MSFLPRDLRYALRALARSPGFTAVAVLTLALGIGVNTAIFSVVHAALLEELPFPEAGRLVAVAEQVERDGLERRALSYPDYLDYSRESTSFDLFVANADISLTLTGDGPAERLEAELVGAGYFELLGAEPVLGRGFLAEEDATPDSHPVAVIGFDLWQRRFGGRSGVLGETLRLEGREVEVVGVAPEGFLGLDDDTELWVPMAMASLAGRGGRLESRGSRWLGALARLAPGVGVEEARAELTAISERLAREHPETNAGYSALVTPYAELVRRDARPVLWVLLGAVGFVLLIACVNVANLMLARSAVRRRETAVRAALGAGRGRLIVWCLGESLVLGLAGGLLGLLMALWGIEVLVRATPGMFPSYVEVELDGAVLAFSSVLAVASGLLMGLLPALQLSGGELGEALTEGGRSGALGGSQQRLRGLLVVSEVALALLLLVGAGLMARSFERLRGIDLGFEPEGVLSLYLALPLGGEEVETGAWRMAEQLLERVAALPGVSSAALASDIPFGGSSSATWSRPEGWQEEVDEEGRFRVYTHVVSPSFFETAGVPLLRGRGFEPQDGPEAPPVLVVSERLARTVWPGEEALGRRIRFGRDADATAWTVVGVAGDARHRALVDDPFEDPDDPDLYFSLTQIPRASLALLVRSEGELAALADPLRRTIAELDRDVALYAFAPWSERVAEETETARLGTFLMAVFGALALSLALLGVYGVISYSVAQRRREIGLRVALGARRRDVVRWVVGQALRLTVTGVAVGSLAALGLSRLLEGLLYEVDPADPLTYAAIALLLVLAASAASLLPARRAARVDPATTLRQE